MKEQTPPEVSLWVHGPLRESAEEGVHTSTYAHKVLGPGHWGKPRFPCSARPPAHLLHQQVLELPLAVLHALAVGAVHHPDEAVGALKVVPPVGPQGLLAAHIPDVQLESGQGGGGWRVSLAPRLPSLPCSGRAPPRGPRSPSVLQGLDVEAQRRGDGVDVFPIELLEDGCFASIVQATGVCQVKEESPCSAAW